ncbi:MAG: hypothetical protein OYH77_01720 [Pseudomonadota bacterium]|nr:hypothetical protein [Pseudomonadota bacterium]
MKTGVVMARGIQLLMFCLLFATSSPMLAGTPTHSISERIIARKALKPLAKIAGVVLFCSTVLGCGKAVKQELQATPPPAQVQSEQVQPLRPELQHDQDAWPERMYINDMGGVKGTDIAQFHTDKDSLPAAFYDRVFVLHEHDGFKYVHLVRPLAALVSSPEPSVLDSTLTAISSSGQPIGSIFDTSDVKEILIADHHAYADSRSAVVAFSKTIPLGTKKIALPEGYDDIHFAGDIYMVLSGKHLLIRVFAAGDLNSKIFKELKNNLYVLALKKDTVVMQLQERGKQRQQQRPRFEQVASR